MEKETEHDMETGVIWGVHWAYIGGYIPAVAAFVLSEGLCRHLKLLVFCQII